MKKKTIIKWTVVVIALLIGCIGYRVLDLEMELKDSMFLDSAVILSLQTDQNKLGENRIHRVYYNEDRQRYSIVLQMHDSDTQRVREEALKIFLQLDGKDLTGQYSVRFHRTPFQRYAIFYLEGYPKAQTLAIIYGDEEVNCTFRA